jgi:TonB family protein
MNTQSKFRAADILILGLLATLAGCANAPLHHSTIEASALPANIQPPVPLNTVAPRYPDAMKRAGVDGTVTVYCLVDENGRVKEASVTNTTDRSFDGPAVEALWKWVFKPAQRDGIAVPMRVNVPVHFTIAEM